MIDSKAIPMFDRDGRRLLLVPSESDAAGVGVGPAPVVVEIVESEDVIQRNDNEAGQALLPDPEISIDEQFILKAFGSGLCTFFMTVWPLAWLGIIIHDYAVYISDPNSRYDTQPWAIALGSTQNGNYFTGDYRNAFPDQRVRFWFYPLMLLGVASSAAISKAVAAYYSYQRVAAYENEGEIGQLLEQYPLLQQIIQPDIFTAEYAILKHFYLSEATPEQALRFYKEIIKFAKNGAGLLRLHSIALLSNAIRFHDSALKEVITISFNALQDLVGYHLERPTLQRIHT